MKSVRNILTGMQSVAITVRQERCAMVRNRNAACLRCADACTSGCIHFEDGELAVDLAKCVGCGTCATVCPTCALETHNPSDADLLAACLRAKQGDVVTIVCHPLVACMPEDTAAAKVVCLGRVEESLLVQLAAKGVREVVLQHGRCAACPQQKGAECARMVCESAHALLCAWGSSMAITMQQVSTDSLAHNQPIAASAPSAGAAADDEATGPAIPKVRKDGTLAHFLPDRRERLLDALSALGEPAVPTLATRLWGMVVINGQKCSSCRMCSTFCPTGAIARFDDKDGTFGVEHYPGDCVKCGTCQAICTEGAIQIFDAVPPAYVLGGEVHRYRMTPRPVEFGAHQIYQTVSRFIDGASFER